MSLTNFNLLKNRQARKVAVYQLIIVLLLMIGEKKREREFHFLSVERYGDHPMQQFNLYTPKGSNAITTPVLFLIHGGYWRFGDKNDYHQYINDKLSVLFPNYAFVSIGYRLFDGEENKFPVQEQDVRACVDYVLTNNSKYRISRKFALYGSSVGANLALLYAYKPYASYCASAVIDISGVIDLRAVFNEEGFNMMKRVLIDMAGHPTTTDSIFYSCSSPIKYITSKSIPTLVVHGDEDSAVPFQQSVSFVKKLNENNVINSHRFYEGEEHTLSGVQNQVDKQLFSFLTENMK